MKKSLIDPLFLKFSQQENTPYVNVYIKVNQNYFKYKHFDCSNDKNSQRLLTFKEELLNLFKKFPQSKITNYLCNINVVEADIHISDTKKILKTLKFNGIQILN